MNNVTTIGIDLAKSSFSIFAVNLHGKQLFKKTLTRKKLLSFFANQPPALIGMEACSGAHYWARELIKLGHTPKIMAPKFVTPYRKGEKNDYNDAEAICEAVGRPNMRFVPIKTAEQQAILCLHRIRQATVKERTATINQVRGLLLEFGLPMAKGRYSAQKALPDILEDADNGLPDLARTLLYELQEQITALNQQVLAFDRQISLQAKQSADAQQIMTLSGIGELTATAVVASVSDARQFKSGRQFSAWLGLAPRQYSTGGKAKLGRISKRGDAYLRTLLVHGARSVINALGEKDDKLSCWVRALIERRGYKRALVALAAKNARIIWAMLVNHEDYRAIPA